MTTQRRARLLVVDDSTFVRRTLRRIFDAEPDFTVVGEAGEGEEALAKLKELRPDLVTLDIQMPGMDGLTALKAMRERFPDVPVLVFASAAQNGGAVAFEALGLGAFEFIDKSRCTSMDLHTLGAELVSTARAALELRQLRASGVYRSLKKKTSGPSLPREARLVAIGASTGGPEAVRTLLDALPETFPVPVVVVQHMPLGFTLAWARRLGQTCRLDVQEAEEGDAVRRGRVLVAPAGRHIGFRKGPDGLLATLSAGPASDLHVPSVDVLFSAAAEAFRGEVIGIVLTGMGSDGKEGARKLSGEGGFLVAEAEESCAVYGMPRAVVQAGLANVVWPLHTIRDRLAGLGSEG